MITREEPRQLAAVEPPAGWAITFYFQPRAPQDKTQREEAILAKELVRTAVRNAERSGNHQGLREDLQKIQRTAETLYGTHSLGKAIFACRDRGIWREVDLPARLGRSQLKVDSVFHLRPLVAAQSGSMRTCIALVNRIKARIFELERHGEALRQRADLEFGPLPKTGRSDGYLGYEAGHRERHAENEIKNHFRLFADSLQLLLNRDKFEALVIGCHDDAWPELEPLLHTYLKQRLLGRFLVDPVAATAEEVREHAVRILAQNRHAQLRALVREAVGEAQRNGRGAVGLRRVLTALERQAVQTLLVRGDVKSEAAECTNCRRLDTRMVRHRAG